MKQRLTIIRGLPGSGKSTFAKALKEDRHSVIIEVDDYLYVDGEYHYSPERHAAAFETALDVLMMTANSSTLSPDIIFVDCLPKAADVKRIRGMVDDSFEIIEITMNCSVTDSFKRNVHGVPMSEIERIKREFE